MSERGSAMGNAMIMFYFQGRHTHLDANDTPAAISELPDVTR
jgi:hypothetical protein